MVRQMTICVECAHLVSRGPVGDVRRRCGGLIREKVTDSVSGEERYVEKNAFGNPYKASDQESTHPLCCNINHGACAGYKPA